jgi:hypothetical protein
MRKEYRGVPDDTSGGLVGMDDVAVGGGTVAVGVGDTVGTSETVAVGASPAAQPTTPIPIKMIK